MGFEEDGRLDTVSVRVAMVTWRLMGGWRPTTDEVAQFLSMSHTGAFTLLAQISRVIPITCEEGPANQHNRPRWYVLQAIKPALTPACHGNGQEE